MPSRTAQPATSAREQLVHVAVDDATLEGDLQVPPTPVGVVLFAHGSGSSRHSPRNRAVAAELRRGGLATLLIDLLTRSEEDRDRQTEQYRFDVPFLARRLVGVTDWVMERPELGLPVCYFGASTGAAAALVAAAARPGYVRAVVSRGGRPDLAADVLPLVKAPTLLIVGGRDEEVLELNRQAAAMLCCDKQLVVVPGATHLFEEAGTLEQVARLARAWYLRQLRTHF